MGSFSSGEITVGFNWNRKYGFPECFTFSGACLKVFWLVWGLMHFKLLWPSLDLSQLATSGLALHIRGILDAECGNSHMAGSLCLVREKVRWTRRGKWGVIWEKSSVWFLLGSVCTLRRQVGEIMHIFLPVRSSQSSYGWGCFHQPLGIGCLWWHSPSTQRDSQLVGLLSFLLLLPWFSSQLVLGTETNLGL